MNSSQQSPNNSSRALQTNLVQHASHNASWPTSSKARDWKQNSITSCTAFSIFFATVTTSRKKNFGTYQQSARVTAFHQLYHAGKNQGANWASPRVRMQRLKHDLAGHTIDPYTFLQGGALCLIIMLRNRKPSSSINFISHTSMSVTGDRAFISSAFTNVNVHDIQLRSGKLLNGKRVGTHGSPHHLRNGGDFGFLEGIPENRRGV